MTSILLAQKGVACGQNAYTDAAVACVSSDSEQKQ